MHGDLSAPLSNASYSGINIFTNVCRRVQKSRIEFLTGERIHVLFFGHERATQLLKIRME